MMDTTNGLIYTEGGRRIKLAVTDDELPVPLISVITVAYNAAKHITICIESVKEQSFKNIEHIVIDGASTDGTLDILKAHDNDITYWRSEKDKGIYDAMNKAVKFARGQWFLFLGADDKLLPGFSEMAQLLTDPACIYYGDFVFETMRKAGGEFDAYRFSKACICHQNIYYPKLVFERYRYDEKYPINADYHLNLKLWADKAIRFEYHPIIIAMFSSAGVSSTKVDKAFEKDKKKNIRKYLGTLVYYRYLLKEFRKKVKPAK
jgi:glycosyltransferase involved in cell wall biosynthesis